MKYLLTIYSDESRWADMSDEDSAKLMAAYEAFGREAAGAGVLRGGEGLQPTATATTVRVRDGETMLTDGPFAETREQLGGYYLLECKDIDEAAGWAAKVPYLGEDGSVEVRPIVDWEAAADEQAGAEASAG